MVYELMIHHVISVQYTVLKLSLRHTCSIIFIGLYIVLIIIIQLPHTIQGLTQVEEMLISTVLLIMSVYRLPHGQYGYSGHVISLPQDVASFTTSLNKIKPSVSALIGKKNTEIVLYFGSDSISHESANSNVLFV